jgi:uncharacterized membrane protein YbhN (UPF0104 family)
LLAPCNWQKNCMSRQIKPWQGLRRRLSSPSLLVLILANLILYIVLLLWVRRNIDFARLEDNLSQVPISAVLLSLGINLAALALYGTRMALFLGRDFRVGFSVINIGYALNTILPLRLGEAIKILLGHRIFGAPLTAVFAASIAEKLVDLFKVLLLTAAVVVFAAGEFVQRSTLYSVTLLVGIGVAAVVTFRIYIVRVLRLFPRGSRLRRISIELHRHGSGYPVWRILGVTIAIWALNVALVFVTFNTYIPGLHAGILDAVALLLILALAIAIPSAPAGVGLFEAGIVAYLTQRLGTSNEAALAAAVVFHLVITVPQLILTAVLLVFRHDATSHPD